MQIIYECCCGLDVHKKRIVACLLSDNAAGQRQQEIRTFGTMTQDLLALADWLRGAGCTHVAMESTGVYWKPVFNLLEGLFEVLVAVGHTILGIAYHVLTRKDPSRDLRRERLRPAGPRGGAAAAGAPPGTAWLSGELAASIYGDSPHIFRIVSVLAMFKGVRASSSVMRGTAAPTSAIAYALT